MRLLCSIWLLCCGLAWGHLPQASHTAYYDADGAGNVTALMDAQEGIAARYLYSPFGRLTGQWGPMAEANRYRFSSKEVHAASGLSYYGFRFYDTSLQRWLNPDPLGEAGGINLYGFVSNDPLTRIDPFGESDENRPPVVVFPPSSGQLPLFGSPAREPQITQGDVGNPLAMLDLQRVMNYLLDPIVPVQYQYLYHDNTPPGFVDLGLPGPPGGLGKMPCRSAAVSGAGLADDLAAAATRARNTAGPGSGGAYGTRVHTAFEAEVQGLNQGLSTEISYLNGREVLRGTPGSVRLDVVNGPRDAPISIFDLKTGGAQLTPARIQQIQSHVPGGANVPVFEVRP